MRELRGFDFFHDFLCFLCFLGENDIYDGLDVVGWVFFFEENGIVISFVVGYFLYKRWWTSFSCRYAAMRVVGGNGFVSVMLDLETASHLEVLLVWCALEAGAGNDVVCSIDP